MVKSRLTMPVTEMITHTFRHEPHKYKTLTAEQIHRFITSNMFAQAKYETVRRTLDIMSGKENHLYSWLKRVGESQYQSQPTQNTRVVLFD
jgi:hypothetical protein